MLKITDHGGQVHLVAPSAIARITEASVSSKWHGIRAIVKLFDGSTIEARDSLDELLLKIEQAQAGGQ